MEVIRGKHVSFINVSQLYERLAGYEAVHMDIGTGDGRFVRNVAVTCPQRFVIGIDAARENLHAVSRRAPENALFVIANAQNLPPELTGLAVHITINFPWGSLLEGLLRDDPALLVGLAEIARSESTLEIRLNGGALAEAGWPIDEGADRVREVLAVNGFVVHPSVTLTARDLRDIPTTWAKRLAYGRDPRAVYLRGTWQAERSARATPAVGVGAN
jgi:hypothetical protein